MDAAAGESAPSSARKMSRSCSARLARLAVVLLVASLLTTADSCSVTQNGTEMTVAVVYASNASPRDTVVATFQSSGVTATAADNTYIKVGFNTTTGDIELITTEAFESYEKTNEVSTFGIYITCTCKDSANALSLQVNVQLNLTNKYAPVFISDGAEVAAAVALTAAMPLHKGSVLLGGCDRALQAVDYGLDSSTVRFSVSDDWFAVSASPASVGPSGKPGYEVKVTTARLLDLEEPRVFTLTATDGGSPPRSTELKITVTPDAAQSTPPSPWFEQPVYTAELTESMSSGDELTFNTGITISEGYDSAMKISLETTDSTDWSSMFSVHHSSKSVQIRLAQNLTEELLKKPFVAFILKANRDNALKEGRTVILLTLPGSKPITTTTSTTACPPTVSGTATCPPCPTAEVGTTVGTTSTQSSVPTETTSASSTVTAPARLVRFNSSLYEFSGSWPCHGPHLVLGRVEASVVGGVGSPAYSLEGAPDSVKIDNATGVLTLQRPLVPKFYHFKVVAEWNNSRDEATVAVAVFNLQSCAANSTGLQYVFVIADFDEESEHSISGAQLLNETSCVWAKVSEDPPDRNFFDVASDGAVSTKGIDREDAVFAGRNLSEVLLTVNVTCDGQQDEVSAPEDSSDPTKAWYPLKNLRTSSREVSYLAVVNDINDNRPQFEEGASLVVGYPDEQLARQLAPRSLVTVHATDKDEGLNAYVRYEIAGDGGNQFVVHPHSGAVYPAESGFQFRDTGFQVLARDRDGAAGCLQSDPLSVQVRMLGSRHVTVLTVEDRLVEDSDAVLGQLRAGSGLDVKLLAAAVLPSAATRSRLAARPGSLLRLVAYALNSSDHTPVPFSDLKKTLDGASLGFKWGISQLADPGSATTLASGADSSGLVAAVATLGVLLALAVAAVLGGTYFFIIRRRRGSSEGSYDNIIRADSSDSPTLNEPPMSAYEANIMVAYNEQLNKYDGQQRGPPLDGTEEEEEEGEEGEAPPRKSVAFSPTVDRIGDDESDVDVIRL
ncbi:uncharacterized protein LOC134533759 isoform X6 [Bacillus rossius redtenbacheri]|uniref:uncharacterized protein LOC134533759 isoform X6 n=1 Tax=Bacillus rossius redtenbacheri TaxID=93214 RepID=UPI002FDC9E34